jgi:hypothetical protein
MVFDIVLATLAVVFAITMLFFRKSYYSLASSFLLQLIISVVLFRLGSNYIAIVFFLVTIAINLILILCTFVYGDKITTSHRYKILVMEIASAFSILGIGLLVVWNNFTDSVAGNVRLSFIKTLFSEYALVLAVIAMAFVIIALLLVSVVKELKQK